MESSMSSTRKLEVMAHLVAGYPDLETSFRLARVLDEAGVSKIEIQIPFSDPLADGPVIMKACSTALEGGVRVSDCFSLCERIAREVTAPIYVMTYANLPFIRGVPQFVRDSANSGVDGVIIPDLPYDNEDLGLISSCEKSGISWIQVVSPGMSGQRLEGALSASNTWLYSTLRVGITGTGHSISSDGVAFLKLLSDSTELPIAAGFGISKVEHLQLLMGVADIAVVGSRCMELLDSEGIDGVGRFISRCVEIGQTM